MLHKILGNGSILNIKCHQVKSSIFGRNLRWIVFLIFSNKLFKNRAFGFKKNLKFQEIVFLKKVTTKDALQDSEGLREIYYGSLSLKKYNNWKNLNFWGWIIISREEKDMRRNTCAEKSEKKVWRREKFLKKCFWKWQLLSF